jgi:hypothetical protein
MTLYTYSEWVDGVRLRKKERKKKPSNEENPH